MFLLLISEKYGVPDWWNRRSYLRYMRKVNENKGAEGREEMKKAFEFMLGHIGV